MNTDIKRFMFISTFIGSIGFLNVSVAFGEPMVKQALAIESKVVRIAKERAEAAIQILNDRVHEEAANFSTTTKAQREAISLQWNAAFNRTSEAASLYIQNQLNAHRLELSEIRYRAQGAAAGAAMASVSNLRLDYSRDSVNRTAPKQLQLMALQLRSGIGSVQSCAAGLAQLADGLTMLRKPDTAWALEFESVSNPSPYFSALAELDLMGFILGMSASNESEKSTNFRGLLQNLAPYAYQSPNSSSLRAMIAASEDYKYPSGALALIRSMISAHGVGWLAYGRRIQESVSLTTGALAEFCNNAIQGFTARVREFGDPEDTSHILILEYVQVQTAQRLLSELIQQHQQSNQDREEIAVLLDRTAIMIQNAPSTGASRLQALIDSLTRLQNDKNHLAQEAQDELANQLGVLSSRTSEVLENLRALAQIRAEYQEYLRSVSVDLELVESLQQSWSDVDSIKSYLLPLFWSRVIDAKSGTDDAKVLKPLNKCISILMDELLIGAEKERLERFQSCTGRTEGRKQSKRGEISRALISNLRQKIKKVNLTKFMNHFETEMYGSTLSTFARSVELTTHVDTGEEW